jgi:predicted RNase H-like HicB family nuclease
MVEKYGVVFFWDEEYEGYVAEAVGLPGCFSQGKTMEEAIENIKDAIKGYIYVERKNNRLQDYIVPKNHKHFWQKSSKSIKKNRLSCRSSNRESHDLISP